MSTSRRTPTSATVAPIAWPDVARVPAYLAVFYALVLTAPFHGPTLALFVALALISVAVTVRPHPRARAWVAICVVSVTLLYGLLDAVGYHTYTALVLTVLFMLLCLWWRALPAPVSGARVGAITPVSGARVGAITPAPPRVGPALVGVVARGALSLLIVGLAGSVLASARVRDGVTLGTEILRFPVLLAFYLPPVAVVGLVLALCLPLGAFCVWAARSALTPRGAPVPALRRGVARRVGAVVGSLLLTLLAIVLAALLVVFMQPRMYLAAALADIRATAYFANRVDWGQVVPRGVARAQRGASARATYPVIATVLGSLGDRHSAFHDPASAVRFFAGTSADPGYVLDSGAGSSGDVGREGQVLFVYPGSAAARAGVKAGDHVTLERAGPTAATIRWRPARGTARTVTLAARPFDTQLGADGRRIGRVGYVRLFATYGTYATTTYAPTLQGLIRRLDATAACGWIVDLRLNNGGTTAPMIQGIGPILGDGGTLVGYVNRDGSLIDAYGYRDGRVLTGPGQSPQAFAHPYRLKRPDPPVAVLTAHPTASAAEGVLMAFLGRRDTRTFGEPTYGVPTTNGTVFLADTSFMLVMDGIGVDRRGHTHDAPIAPDETIANAGATFGAAADPVIRRAWAWLGSQAACR